ncbi:restriction endonuclease PLD domain-containing protein [Selenomonas ruminantium]|uniref:NgoFVII restriction endonuclease n=1 Tax=Selenomonas ruminantium TaxID=971 RepID=A0A1H3VQ82_SELRU|nr:restriction endonuclease PLD domain-containing protein [Selenomonas ruminantium]SDZ76936.1 NgoFVII restriction endonuclease [Selenomonas ruminantium]
MHLLYSNILPLRVKPGEQSFLDAFTHSLDEADRLDVATGYASKGALLEIDRILQENTVSKVRINLGMYFIEGMPEGMYHAAMELAEKWQDTGQGEIHLVRPFKYHGKVYVFYKNDQPFRAFIGSHNLGAVKLEAANRRQYELSAMTENPEEVKALAKFVEELWQPKCSLPIADITGMTLITEKNMALNGVQEVSQLPPNSVELYDKHITLTSFELPLKVPAADERFMDDGKHYTKSNINVAYAAPRNARKARDWYEIQLTVSKSITTIEGYPEKNQPFFVVTDDGYWFKAHTTSDGNKQFSAVGNELLIGRWLKGRLEAAGLVKAVNNTQEDTDRTGMITKEMLAAYGRDTLILAKTDQKAVDVCENEEGEVTRTELDVWLLSFEQKMGNDEA